MARGLVRAPYSEFCGEAVCASSRCSEYPQGLDPAYGLGRLAPDTKEGGVPDARAHTLSSVAAPAKTEQEWRSAPTIS